MVNPPNRRKDEQAKRGSQQSRNGHRRVKSGVKRIYKPTESTGQVDRMVPEQNEVALDHIKLDLPPGPVIQVHSSRMRGLVDTFLKNTSTVHTVLRAILQGPSGGFQGAMDNLVLAHIENDVCSAAIACSKKNVWYIHSSNPDSCNHLLDVVPVEYAPSRIGGETVVVSHVLKHQAFINQEVEHLVECAHFELAYFNFPHSPGGHHRLAKKADIPRLEEYAQEFEKEMGYTTPTDWALLIAENRIFLGVVEGTVASVAIRLAETLEHVLVEGVYTFKPFRRRGLARKLIAALARQATGRGQAARVIVGVDNKPMLSLLEALQFHKTAEYLLVVFE